MQKQVKVIERSKGENSQTINNWLVERHKVLTAYCELAGITPNSNKHKALPQKFFVRHFCQVLMDYISAGHFEVFEHILNECKKSTDDHVNIVNDLCPKIFISTDYALHFNDKYADEIEHEHWSDFDENLSLLGKYLEQRFELEDKLIGSIHSEKH